MSKISKNSTADRNGYAVNLFYQPNLAEGHLYLDADESKHCVRVLRRSKGDLIRITDGRGFFYDAIITNPDARRCAFEVIDKTQEVKHHHFIHIAISPTKNADRLEWFVEKAVEVGVDQITFMNCTNTERPYLKLERMEKVAISAMKQSLKASIPVIKDLTTFSDILQSPERERFIAYVDQQNKVNLADKAVAGSTYLVLIGPEGDFSPAELEAALSNGFTKVSLGHSRLRTETAGLIACHTLNLINR